MAEKSITLNPIGKAQTNEEKGEFSIIIKEKFRPALKELENFTHINILWWANEHDNPKSREITQVSELPPFYGEKAPTMGIFATRSEYRPNPILLTTVQIMDIDQKKGLIKLAYFDAFNGSPIIDIKPYLGMTDRVMSAEYPKYLQHWPKTNEEAAEWWAQQFAEME
jgi:tRNA-Thr(GGU) m(6)t(6)A37 methyltransferase TsaA